MKVVAVIQARMQSTRLPGKVLMNLGGHPVLHWVARAAKAAPGVDEVIVATSTEPADNKIEAWCNTLGNVKCWRGSETDVLDRFVGAAGATDASIVLRLTGDCPFLDPQVIGAVVRLQKQTGAAYVSNVSPRTYPDGLDVEAFVLHALISASIEATRPIDRDCVTTWIARNRSRFPAEALINPIPGMEKERWVLDTGDDLQVCTMIAQAFPWEKGPPSMLDILGLYDQWPTMRNINRHHPMNERYFDALAEEPLYERSYTRSQAQLEKARAVIPLGAQTFSKSYLQYPQPSPLFVTHGEGGLVWDVDGNEYVDCVSALLPNILGYRDPEVDAAIRRQLSSGISFSLATELEAELADILCRIIPCAEAVRFGKSGTDVTSAAIRAARAFTGRDRVLICGGYHGWQDWSVERNLGVPEDVRKLTTRIPFGDGRKLPHFDEKFAAVIVEPETNPGYLQLLRQYCWTSGAVLIFDEVITGFRFDLGGAQAMYGITPDLATFGKAMANGMPLSALVGRKDIMAKFEPPDNVFYSGTMFGETLSLAASIATIRKLERDHIIANHLRHGDDEELPLLWKIGSDMSRAFRLWQKWHNLDDVIWTYGEPPFRRIGFRDDKIAALFRKEMISTGVLIAASFNVCAAHSASDVKRVARSLEHTMGVIRQAIHNNDIDQRLAGATVAPMVRAS